MNTVMTFGFYWLGYGLVEFQQELCSMVYRRPGEPLGGRLPRLSLTSAEILSRAHGDFEEQNEFFGLP